MGSAEDTSFARLVSLACHDLRTPLATVHGFAKTLTRMDGFDDRSTRFLGMIEAASGQLAELLDDLAPDRRVALVLLRLGAVLEEGQPLGRGERPRRVLGLVHVGARQAHLGFEALEQLDIVVRDLERGLVDFPAVIDGREVYLCWLIDEPAVGHWHGVEAGFAGRRPLDG